MGAGLGTNACLIQKEEIHRQRINKKNASSKPRQLGLRTRIKTRRITSCEL
jgi:hypothetical protein